ncbi:hypothetical protein [Legionella sp. CNM-4043-24]|uniref:hypothetical protein n=1 Tax=Legionella sp. CNM-4043-24 TaxID=3421646 RepID=UPI00403AF6C4
MKLDLSVKDRTSSLSGVSASVLTAVLSLNVITPPQAQAASPASQEQQIRALEERVRVLEKLLLQQMNSGKVTVASRQKIVPRKTKPAPHRAKPAPRPAIVKAAPPPPTSALSKNKKIYLDGITITPVGFFAGEGVYRSRSEQTDIGSTFSGIPLGNSPLHYMNEARLSARQSRLGALMEGQVNPDTLLSGYVELDFLGNGTANSNESNSFDLRMREFYANVDWNKWGFHLLAGQNWSLATTNFKGITPRNEPVPPTIDAQYVVGYVWKRQTQLRIVKNMGELLTAALSIENPQTTFGGTPCGTALGNGVLSQFCSAPGVQSLPSTTNFSLNHKPDVIAKLAYEQVFGDHRVHIEGFGLYRSMYNRVQWFPNVNINTNTPAGGLGAGAVIEVLPKRLDLQGNLLGGRGIGSYASGLLPDVTIASNGSLAPIPEVVFMVGATLHATKKLDLYVFGGQEKQKARYFQVGNNFFGYGVPNANNTGCSVENLGVCAGNTRLLWQVTTGLWNKFYQGSYGELRGGLQYSYTVRELFAGTGGQADVASPKNIGYHTSDHMAFASLRYYPFYVPPQPVSESYTK